MTASPWRNDDMMLVEPPDVMSPDEFLSSGRCPMILEAAEKVRSRREDLFLICGMEDAFSTAYQMTGLETFLMGAMMDPDLCRSWVEAVKPCLKAYAAALSEVSDDVQLIVESATDVMPAEMFHDFVERSASDIVGCIKKSYSTVHSCGETSEILEDLASMGETGLSIETYYDPVGVAERIAEKVRIVGGVPPVNHLMQGTPAIIREALAKTYKARCYILDEIMLPVIAEPRKELSKWAPKMLTTKIDPEKIGDVIGKQGKVIQKICAECNCKIDVEEDGSIYVSSTDIDCAKRAIDIIETIANDPEEGAIYKGVVTRLMSFGVFVEIAPGKEGMVHISQLDVKRTEKVEDVVNVGDEIIVKVLPKDDQGRLNFSRREALIEVEGLVPENDVSDSSQRRSSGPRRNFNRDRKPRRNDD